jgi:hypothetical protein
MADLLLHSMSEFSEIILTCLETAEARQVVEIGAEFGGMSAQLASYAERCDGRLICIDPAPQARFTTWLKTQSRVRHIAAPSLEALPQLRDIDAWLIDGDHNWYTVYHELKAIDAVCCRDGRPMLAFLHDVSWPTARRDSYYAPERIPADYRQPYDFTGGVTLDSPDLIPNRGFRGAGGWAFASTSGNPRNGVLTAVEDFLAERAAEDRPTVFARVPAVFGLGVVFDAAAPWGEALAQILLPLHDNQLLRSLEENRLRNYLAVIDWQDRADAAVQRMVVGPQAA